MPGLDGTGPAGRGPMTGGARGWCNPYSPMYVGAGFCGAPYTRPPYPTVAGYPYRGYPSAAPFWRPRLGLGLRGRGQGGRGRGRR